MKRFELIVVGASLGGLQALQTLLAALPAMFALPLAIVQHRDRMSDERLSALLQRSSALTISPVEDKLPIEPGHVYVAPPDYHLLVESGYCALSTEAPVHYARPAIDVLFESAADAYRERAIGVILTGASKDGAHGLALIKRYGGLAIVQNPDTAESRVMPAAAIGAAPVDYILPIEQIGPLLTKLGA